MSVKFFPGVSYGATSGGGSQHFFLFSGVSSGATSGGGSQHFFYQCHFWCHFWWVGGGVPGIFFSKIFS